MILSAVAEPIFSTSVEGYFRTLAFFVMIVFAVWAFVYKLVTDPIRRTADATVKKVEEIDGRIVEKFEKMELRIAESEKVAAGAVARANEATRTTEVTRSEFGLVRDRLSKVEASVDNLRDQGNLNKGEIIDAFQRRANDMQDGVHKVEVQIAALAATLEERQRWERVTNLMTKS